MNEILSSLLTTVAIIGAIILLGRGIIALFAYSISQAAKAPGKKEIRRAIKDITGCDIGKEFDIVKMDYRFAHSDCPTNISVKVPESKFCEFLDKCRVSADWEDETSLLVRKDMPEKLFYQSVKFDKVEKLLHYHSQGC